MPEWSLGMQQDGCKTSRVIDQWKKLISWYCSHAVSSKQRKESWMDKMRQEKIAFSEKSSTGRNHYDFMISIFRWEKIIKGQQEDRVLRMTYGGLSSSIIRAYESALRCNRSHIINSKHVYKIVSMCRKKRLLAKSKYTKTTNSLWIVRE